MAGTVGQGLNLAGEFFMPGTMDRLRRPGMMEQARREQQVGGIQAGRLFSGMNQEIGTPQTKSFQVNGKTIGQDNPSTVQPLFSGAKKMAMFSQAFPEQGRALMASQLMEQIAPPKPVPLSTEGKRVADSRAGFLGESDVTNLNFPKPASSDPIRTQKINDSMTLYGLNQSDATKLVDGVVQVVPNPFDGSLSLVDKATGIRRDLRANAAPAQPAAAPAPNQEQPSILEEVGFYGPRGAVPETMEKMTFGLFGAEPATMQARQRQRVLRETLLDAFARTGRPSNYAQQRIEELIPSTGVFESPGRAWDAFSVTYNDLSSQLSEDQQIMRDESLPVAMRQEASARTRATQRALRLIGDPSKVPRPQDGPAAGGRVASPKTDEEYNALPSGAVFIDPADGKQYRKP
jgi:hypothetical protein